MSRPLCRQSGLYQWDAKVAGVGTEKKRRVVSVTVFCDTRSDAVEAACHEVGRLGLTHCTVDHITKIG